MSNLEVIKGKLLSSLRKYKSTSLRFIDMQSMGLILFIVLTVWLSFLVRNHKHAIYNLQKDAMTNRREAFNLNMRFNLLNDAFVENIFLDGSVLAADASVHLPAAPVNTSTMPLLYLKPYACSDCYQFIIGGIIEHLAAHDGFYVVSHTSNSYFIRALDQYNIITAAGRIIWTDDERYFPDISESTAELLLVDSKNNIQATLSMEFLRDPVLFSQYISLVKNGLPAVR